MHPIILCYMLRASYFWSLAGKPATVLFRLGQIGRSPTRIYACNDGLFLISKWILLMLMNKGHNFLSPERFVRQVWSEVESTGTSVDPTGSVFYRLFSTCSCIHRRGSPLVSSTTNHQYACLYILGYTPHRICVLEQKPDVQHRHVAEVDTESYLRDPCNRIPYLCAGGSWLSLSSNQVDLSFHTFYFSMYTLIENGPHGCLVTDLPWKTDQYLPRRFYFHGRT